MKKKNYSSPDVFFLNGLDVNLICTSSMGANGETTDYNTDFIYNEME